MGLWLASALALAVATQDPPASVEGTVQDEENGALLVGATLGLTDLGRSTRTDSAGRYRLTDVPTGLWRLRVSRIGYAPRTLQLLVPSTGRLDVSVALRAEPVKLETIEVLARRSRLRDGGSADQGSPDRVALLDTITNHPLLPEADVLQVLSGGEVAVSPEVPTGLSVRGGAADQITYLVDDVPVLSPYHAAGSFGALNPDALAQMSVIAFSPAPAFPEALSATVSARTRTAGSRMHLRGSSSTNQAGVTLDGPLGPPGSEYLVSVRSGFTGLLGHKEEASHLGGASGDWLGKLEVPVLGGRLRLVGLGAQSEISAAAVLASDTTVGIQDRRRRHSFTWDNWSVGASWTAFVGGGVLQLRAWNAVGGATAQWKPEDSAWVQLGSRRQDQGLAAAMELAGDDHRTSFGVRAQASWTEYELQMVPTEVEISDRSVRTPVVSAFASHQQQLTATSDLTLSLTGTRAVDALHLSPAVEFRWQPAASLSFTGGASRRHQFSQSLRNPESVVGAIFPADLHVGAGASGVPVARSDQVLVAMGYRPAPELGFLMQGYARTFSGLALVAPLSAEPFASQGFVTGSGQARGLALEATLGSRRFDLIARYGLQHVRLQYGDSTYTPADAPTHRLDAGVLLRPAGGTTLRLSLSGLLGRRATAVEGLFEWESCNLLDRGCEFVGSPRQRTEPLGATALPAYLRLDLGIRQEWSLRIAGRPGQLALHGTVTNLLGRKNLLTVSVDPVTGTRKAVEMRPLSPLLVGLDWRF